MNEFIYPLKVHTEDTDFAGVVYHSNYLNFMERARSEWAEALGLGIDWQRKHQIYFPVRYAYLDFLSPARLHEHLEVVTSIKSLRAASIIYDQYLRPKGVIDKILCKAEIKVACVDVTLKTRALPEAPIFDTIRRLLT